MNPDKTTHEELSAKLCNIEPLLGCEIDSSKELLLRKRKAAAEFSALYKLWLRDLPISIEMKMRIYNGTVLSHFLHSAGTPSFSSTSINRSLVPRSHLQSSPV
jgi:hypothetical protein